MKVNNLWIFKLDISISILLICIFLQLILYLCNLVSVFLRFLVWLWCIGFRNIHY